MKGRPGSKGEDTEGDSNPIMVARKAISIGQPVLLVHKNKQKTNIAPKFAHRLLDHYDGLRKPCDKEEMIQHCWHSPEYMYDYLAGIISIEHHSGVPSMPKGWKPNGGSPTSGAYGSDTLKNYTAVRLTEVDDLEEWPD